MPPADSRKSLSIVELVAPTGPTGYYWSARKSVPYLLGVPGVDFGGPYQGRLEAAAEALAAHRPGLVAIEPVVLQRQDLDEREGGWPVHKVTLRFSVELHADEMSPEQPAGFVAETGLDASLGEVVPLLRSASNTLDVLSVHLVRGSVALSRQEGISLLGLLVDARWRLPARENPIEFLRALSAEVSLPALGIEARPAKHAFVFRAVPSRHL
jgi:hypothetical protein